MTTENAQHAVVSATNDHLRQQHRGAARNGPKPVNRHHRVTPKGHSGASMDSRRRATANMPRHGGAMAAGKSKAGRKHGTEVASGAQLQIQKAPAQIQRQRQRQRQHTSMQRQQSPMQEQETIAGVSMTEGEETDK